MLYWWNGIVSDEDGLEVGSREVEATGVWSADGMGLQETSAVFHLKVSQTRKKGKSQIPLIYRISLRAVLRHLKGGF